MSPTNILDAGGLLQRLVSDGYLRREKDFIGMNGYGQIAPVNATDHVAR